MIKDVFLIKEASRPAAGQAAGQHRDRAKRVLDKTGGDVARLVSAGKNDEAASAVNRARADIDRMLAQWAQEILQ